MTDDDQPVESNVEQPVAPPLKPLRALRWRIIPGTLLSIFFVVGCIGAPLALLQVLNYNRQHGWIHQIDPHHPMAITAAHMLVGTCSFIAVAVSGISAYAWFYGRWRLAWAGLILYFGLIFTSNWLESL